MPMTRWSGVVSGEGEGRATKTIGMESDCDE